MLQTPPFVPPLKENAWSTKILQTDTNVNAPKRMGKHEPNFHALASLPPNAVIFSMRRRSSSMDLTSGVAVLAAASDGPWPP